MTSFRTPYAGYDVLSKRDSPSWDAQTRAAIDRRLNDVPARRFFSEMEWQTLEAIWLPCAEDGETIDRVIAVSLIEEIA